MGARKKLLYCMSLVFDLMLSITPFSPVRRIVPTVVDVRSIDVLRHFCKHSNQRVLQVQRLFYVKPYFPQSCFCRSLAFLRHLIRLRERGVWACQDDIAAPISW